MTKKEAFENLADAIKKCKDSGFLIGARYFNDDIGAHVVDSIEIENSNEGPVLVFYADDLGWWKTEQILHENNKPRHKIGV